MFGVEAHARIGLEDLYGWKEGAQTLTEAFPRETTALAPAPQRVIPETQHVLAERSHPSPVPRKSMLLEIPPHHLLQPLQGVGYAIMQPLA